MPYPNSEEQVFEESRSDVSQFHSTPLKHQKGNSDCACNRVLTPEETETLIRHALEGAEEDFLKLREHFEEWRQQRYGDNVVDAA